jgi:tetratricopeptide (TPR) repeat protein
MARIRCLLWLTVLALTPAAVRAQPSPLARPSEFSNAAFDRAEKKFRALELQEAEQLYLQALQDPDRGWHSRCYDQLLTIYARLGRYDRALQMVDRYQPLLEEQNDWTRIRALNLRRGELLLGLGHIRTAERYLEESLNSPRGKALSPAHALTARMCLARAAEIRGDRARAGRFWGEVEGLAREQALQPRQALTARQRIECLCMLADSYRFQEQHEKAFAPWKRC